MSFNFRAASEALKPFTPLLYVVASSGFICYKYGQRSRDVEVLNLKVDSNFKITELQAKLDIEASKKETAEAFNRYFHGEEYATARKNVCEEA